MKIKLLFLSFLGLVLHWNFVQGQTVYYTQNFSTGALPAGWTNDSLGLPSSNLWLFNNPYSRVITGASFDANFAIFDSDEGTSNDNIDEYASLTTATINLNAATGPLYLLLDQQYRALAGPFTDGSSRRIEMSINNGTNWTTLVYDSLDLGYPTAILTSYDISAAAGSANVKFRFTYTGTYDWWWAIDNIKIQDQTDPCAGVTLAGDITADSLVICQGGTVNLVLAPNLSAASQPVQWYASSNGITYTPISGATSFTYNQVINAVTYFKASLTCSGATVFVDSVTITLNPIPTCYCYPISPTCNTSDFIASVSLNTLFNANSCNAADTVSGYTFHPASLVSTSIKGWLTYTLSVTTNSDNIISAWIDYNRNHVYEASEWYQVCTTSTPNVANNIQITVPGTALPGLTGMRIRSRAVLNNNGATDACTEFFSGETEDYEITILDSILGLAPLNQLEKLKIYPQLSDGIVTVDMGQSVQGAQLSVLDVTGKESAHLKLEAIPVQYIDLSHLSEGIYFIRIATAGEFYTTKIVVKK